MDKRQYKVELTAEDKSAGAFNSLLQRVANTEGAFDGLVKKMAAGFGVGYFAHLVRESINAAVYLRDMTKSTGLLVEELAGAQLLARQTGTSFDGLATAINRMSVAIGKDPEAFRALGITAKTNKEAFQQFADLFNLLPDIQQRNALAQKVFNKSWQEMAPVFAEGGQRIGEIMDKGAALSGITQQLTDDADQLNDKWADLTATGGLLNRQIGPLLPLLITLADDLLSVQDEAHGASDEFNLLLETMKPMVIMAGLFIDTFSRMGKELGGWAAQLAALARGDLSGFMAIRKEMMADADKDAAAWEKWQQKILDVGVAARTTGATVKTVDHAAAAGASARAAAFIKEGNAAGDVDSAYRNLVKGLKEKLLVGSELTEVNKLDLALAAMSEKQINALTGAQLEYLVSLAEQVDLNKRNKAAIEAHIKAQEQSASVMRELDEWRASEDAKRDAAILSQQEVIEQIQFETRLIGLSNEQRQIAIAMRALETSGIDTHSLAYTTLAKRIYEVLKAQQVVQANFDTEPAAKTLKDVVSYLDPARAESFGDALRDAFGGASNALVKLTSALQNYGQKQAEIGELQKALADDPDVSTEKRIRLETELAEKQAKVQLRAYGDMAGAAKEFFATGSKGYNALAAAEKAFRAFELAIAMDTMLVKSGLIAGYTGLFVAGKATETAATVASVAPDIAASMAKGTVAAAVGVATQAQGDPYSAWARMAMMVAAMAALGFMVSGGSGGGGGSSTPPVTNKGTGTVLGDSEAQSESIRNSIESLASMAKPQLTFIGQMVALLRNIDNTLAGTTDALLSSGFDSRGSSFQGSKTSDSTLWGLFGSSSSSTSLADVGLAFAKQTVAEAMRMINVSQYQTTKTDWTSSGLFGFGSDSGTNYNTTTSAIDPAIGASMSRAVGYLVDTLSSIGTRLGASPEAIAGLGSTDTGFGNVSLLGKTGEEINQVLSAVFSKLGDTLTRQLMPEIGEFQKSGEGLLQTLIRVVATDELVTSTMMDLDLAMGLTGIASIRASDAIVEIAGGLDKFAQITTDYYENFFTPAERHGDAVEHLKGQFAALGVEMPATNEGLRALIQNTGTWTPELAATTVALIGLSGTFNDVMNSVVGLDGKLHTLDEVTSQHKDLQGDLDVAMGTRTAREVDNEHRRADAIDATSLAIVNATIKQEDANTIAATNLDWSDRLALATGTMTQRDIELRNATEQLGITTDATTIELMQQTWAAEDLAEATRHANEVLAEGAGLAARYAQMTGDNTQSRILELQAIDPANRAWLLRIWALEQEQAAAQNTTQTTNNLAASYRDVAQAQQKVLQGLVQFGRSIKDFLHSLDIGTTTATPLEQFNAAQAMYLDNLRKAREGDTEAQGQLARDAQTYIDKTQQMYASGGPAQAILAQIKSELGALPEVEDYDANLAALKLIEERLATLNTSVQSGGSNTVSAVNAIPFAIKESDLLVLERLGDMFAVMDANSDLSLTFEEFSSVMAGKASEGSIRALFDLTDTNHDGMISVLESNAVSSTADAAALLAGLVPQFSQLDADLSGGLTFAELQVGLAGKASDTSILALITRADANNDGIVTELELNTAVTSKIGAAAYTQASYFRDWAIRADQQWQFNDIFRTQNGQQYTMLTAIRDTLAGGILVRASNGAFAAGGMFGGGLRLVGEQGPELEVTGPSRIFSASDTRSILSGAGGGGGEDVAQEVRELKATVKALLERIAHGQNVQTTVIAKGSDKTAKATADAAWRQEVKPVIK